MHCYWFSRRPRPTAQTSSYPNLSNPEVDQDLESKTLSELHDIIIALKTKHYYQGGTSAVERVRWARARQVFEQKQQALPHLKGVCNNDIIINQY